MRGWGRIALATAIGLVVGVAGGGYAGLRLGMDTMANRWVKTEARHGEEAVGVLEDLRAGRTDEARAELENHLNRHVFGLMPAAREGVNISERTRDDVMAVTQRIRAYREQYPHNGETALARDVRNYLTGQ